MGVSIDIIWNEFTKYLYVPNIENILQLPKKKQPMSQIINVRMGGEWTDQMYPFTPETMNDLTDVFGKDNIRLIAETEFERHCLRLRQNAAYEKSEAQETNKGNEPFENSAENSAENAANSDENVTAEMLTLVQLREKRVVFFEKKQRQNRWKRRLRPRK